MSTTRQREKENEQEVSPSKLKIGKKNDSFEQEAETVADKVMRMPYDNNPNVMHDGDEGKIQMMSDGPEEEKMRDYDEDIQMMSDGPEVQRMFDDEHLIQKMHDGSESLAAPASVEAAIISSKGSGQSLPNNIQKEMSSKMGADLSNVKVHTGASASQMNEEIGAKAFTHGQDIYFKEGQYDPASSEGKHLLAHELVHTVQQGNEQNSIQRQPVEKNTVNYLRDILKLHENITAEQVHTLPVDEIVQTKEYKDLMNLGYVWQRDFNLTSEQAVEVCRAILVKLSNGEQFNWKHDTRALIKQVLAADVLEPVAFEPIPMKRIDHIPVQNTPLQPVLPGVKGPTIDYAKLLADKKLDIGIGIGYQFENEANDIVALLRTYNIKQTSSSPGKVILEGKRFMKDPADSTKIIPVDISVTLISSEDENASKDFGTILSEKEVVIYSGHARHGVGPDFDRKYRKKGNFKIESSDKGNNDLKPLSKAGKFDPDKYQLWFFNACSSVDYMDEINKDVTDASGKVKPDENLEVIVSKNPVMGDAKPFLVGILDQLSMEDLLESVNKAEHKEQKKAEKERKDRWGWLPWFKERPTHPDSFTTY